MPRVAHICSQNECSQCRRKKEVIDSIRFLQFDHTFVDWVRDNYSDETYHLVLEMVLPARSILRATLANLYMKAAMPEEAHVSVTALFEDVLLQQQQVQMQST
jgi:hypothetical protein